jgi:hypothetical protein
VGTDVNYVVDRAPEGTTTWTLVGSTCGGPSPIHGAMGNVTVRDIAGGVTPTAKYVYRVFAISSNGAAGWNTYHFTAPCATTPVPQATVNGSTVTVTWGNTDYINSCGGQRIPLPDTYTLTSDFGYTKTGTGMWISEPVYGVPLGQHTFTLTSYYRTGYTTAPTSVTATVAY